MEILTIKAKSKYNPNVLVATTEEGEFELHIDVVVKNNIKKGSINDNFFMDCVHQSEEIIAFNIAAKYLGARQKTEQQIKDYIYKKGYHQNIVDFVIEKLKHYNLINDEAYAQSYIRSNPNYSRLKLKAKLSQAGVKNENFENIINQVDDFESCLKSATKFLKNKEINKQTIEKLTRRLASQGYGWETIKATLQKFYNELD